MSRRNHTTRLNRAWLLLPREYEWSFDMRQSSGATWGTRTGIILIVLIGLLACHQLFMVGAFDYWVKERAVAYTQYETLEMRNTWFGMELLQFPNDLMTYQQILVEIKPDLVIETGTYRAGLTVYFATMLDIIHPEAKIVTVDIDMTSAKSELKKLNVPAKQKLLDKIQFIEGSSTDPEVIAQMRAKIQPGQRVLVLLDSLHSRSHVLQELQAYSELVTPNSYIIVNDTHLYRFLPEDGATPANYGGARAAVADFLASNKNFVVDTARDRYMITCSPGGFLKRVK